MTDYLLSKFNAAFEDLVGNAGRMAEEDGWRALRLLPPRPATVASERMATVIQNLRREHGMSTDDLAVATDFHPRSIERIESGQTEPTLTMLPTLAKALGV
jgi:ribosome-binding protein aMBF1 (putative translation factor)